MCSSTVGRPSTVMAAESGTAARFVARESVGSVWNAKSSAGSTPICAQSVRFTDSRKTWASGPPEQRLHARPEQQDAQHRARRHLESGAHDLHGPRQAASRSRRRPGRSARPAAGRSAAPAAPAPARSPRARPRRRTPQGPHRARARPACRGSAARRSSASSGSTAPQGPSRTRRAGRRPPAGARFRCGGRAACVSSESASSAPKSRADRTCASSAWPGRSAAVCAARASPRAAREQQHCP